MFQRNILPTSLGFKSKPSKNPERSRWEAQKPSNSSCHLHPISFLLASFFNLEDGGSAFLQNVCGLMPEYMALQPRRQ
jgi:hypothetical protein